MKRGDLVTIAAAGDNGKPRPALVVQSDAFEAIPSVTTLPLTTDLQEAPLIRIPVRPTAETGLRRDSQIMIDKAMTLPRAKVGGVIGRVGPETMDEVGLALGRFLGVL